MKKSSRISECLQKSTVYQAPVFLVPSRKKNMEVFYVASMRAGKIFDKTWKIQKACIKNVCKTSMQHANFSKTLKNFTKL